MIEENSNQITYDDNWKTVSLSEYPQTVTDDITDFDDKQTERDADKQKKKNNSPKQLLITIQLVLCIVIALFAFVLKNIGGDIYTTVHNWYYSQLNNSVIFDNNSNFSLSELFGTATKDEI